MKEVPVDLTEKRASSILKLADRDPLAAERRFNSLPLVEKMAMILSVRGKDRERLILLSKEPHRFVQGMPEEEFYYTVKEMGERDALALLELASPKQIAFCLDLEVWKRDRVRPREMLRWLDLLLECGEEKLVEVLRGLDEELLVTFLKRHLKVYKPDAPVEEVEVDHPDLFTLDQQYFIRIRFKYAEDFLMRLLDVLFRRDQPLYRRLMEGVIWDVPAEVEELAFRWRQGRLADRGFPELEDALEIYRYVEPELVKVQEGIKEAYGPDDEMKRWGDVGSNFYLLPLPSESFLRQVLEVASTHGLDWLKGELVYLCNRAMVADGVDPSDLEGVKALLERVYDYLNLGLSYLARGDLQEGLKAIRKLYLREIFQVGFSLTLRLRRRLERFLRSNPWFPHGKEDLHLLDPPWREAAGGLLRRKPLLYEGLLHRESSTLRTFRDLEEVAGVEEFLDHLQGVARLHELYGWNPQEVRRVDLTGCHPSSWEDVTFKTLTLTALAHAKVRGEFRFLPIGPGDLRAFLMEALEVEGNRAKPRLKARFREEVLSSYRELARGLPPRLSEGAMAFIEEALGDLTEEFGGLDLSRPPDPRFVRLIAVRGK